jgi:predicted transcriptional regulator
MDIFSEHFDQYTPPPSTAPDDAGQYQLAPRALENAMLRKMGKISFEPTVRKPADHPGGKTAISSKRHVTIRTAIVDAVAGQWLSIDQIAEAISEDRDIVRNKVGPMVARGLLEARGHAHTRRFTKGKNPKKRPPKRIAVNERRDIVVKAISGPMVMNEIMKATGLDRHTLQGDLHWLSRRGLIQVLKVKHGIPATYSPVEEEHIND